jgi:hypothetical protein
MFPMYVQLFLFSFENTYIIRHSNQGKSPIWQQWILLATEHNAYICSVIDRRVEVCVIANFRR